jgi:uncharacterized protein (DUF924 family)
MSVTHSAGNDTDDIEPAWVGEVLFFWFDELQPAQWFAKDKVIDARIRGRFLALQRRVAAGDESVAMRHRPLLAAVIILDQFSRNLFRGTKRAFAADPLARELSRTAIKQRLDDAMNERERLFLYMPFEHSEDREDQAIAVDLISRLGNEGWSRDAIAHKRIIDQFGRFPHRNAILERASSQDETAFLREPEPSWL